MKVLYKVRDCKGCNYTKSGDIGKVSWMIEGVPNRVGVIKVLMVKCGDVIMTRCPRIGCGDQAPQ